MILKSFGCSFIFGNELHDDGYNSLDKTPSQQTWPALLAKDLDYEYQCHARPGSGNLQILECLLNQLDKEPIDLCIVGWTWIDRFDYNDPLNDRWKTITPMGADSYSEFYYRNLHSQYRDKLSSLIYIKTTINFLKEKQIKFIMTCIDDLIFETKWHSNSAIIELQEYIRPYMTTFDGLTFLDWSKEKGFPISKTLHPLESAHQAGFELIKSYNLV